MGAEKVGVNSHSKQETMPLLPVVLRRSTCCLGRTRKSPDSGSKAQNRKLRLRLGKTPKTASDCPSGFIEWASCSAQANQRAQALHVLCVFSSGNNGSGSTDCSEQEHKCSKVLAKGQPKTGTHPERRGNFSAPDCLFSRNHAMARMRRHDLEGAQRRLPALSMALVLFLELAGVAAAAATTAATPSVALTPAATPSPSSTATVYNASAAAATGIVRRYAYRGCFLEISGLNGTAPGARSLQGDATDEVLPGDMTVPKCLAFCGGGGSGSAYTYAALEYARECWCGQELSGLAAQEPEAQCDLACDGDNSTLCGGNLRLTVGSCVPVVFLVVVMCLFCTLLKSCRLQKTDATALHAAIGGWPAGGADRAAAPGAGAPCCYAAALGGQLRRC